SSDFGSPEFQRAGTSPATPARIIRAKGISLDCIQLLQAARRGTQLTGLTRQGSRSRMNTVQDSEQQLMLYRLPVEESLGLRCIHDLDGVLLAVNPAVERSLGYAAEEGLGRSLKEFLAPSVQPHFANYLERIRTN